MLADAFTGGLREAVHRALAEMIGELPLLAARTSMRLPRPDDVHTVRDRLFAAVAAGAMSGSPVKGLTVSVVSTLWWTGIDADLADATMLALRHVGSLRIPSERKLEWIEDVMCSTTTVTETTLAARARPRNEMSRHEVISGLLGTYGTAFARDAAMTARDCAPHAVEQWRKFGLLYGLLRKLARDERSSTVHDFANPRLVAPALLTAHALAGATPPARDELAKLQRGSKLNPDTHVDLRRLLRSSAVVTAYRADLRELHRRACAELDALDPAPLYDGALRNGMRDVLTAGSPSAQQMARL